MQFRTFTALLLSAAVALGAHATPAAPAKKRITKPQAEKKVVPKVARKAAPKKKPGALVAPSLAFGERADVMRFADELAREQGWDAAALKAQLAQAKSIPAVQRLIMPPPAGTAKNWAAYRAMFVEPKRLEAGLAFWNENEAALARAEQRFGVPAELIVGLIGVETYYGRITGSFRAVDALATLAFDFPQGRSDRSPFFRTELAELLKLARREDVDPFSLKGSYAGAMGLPQFMPGSWNRHAIDFDGDGHVNLLASSADAIGSVANYLANHGWQRGMPTHYSVALPVDTPARARLLAPDIKPSFSSAELREAGAQISEAAQEHAGLLAVIELQNGQAAPSYVLGTANFYALTRYNWSSYYAMAVLDLGRAVALLRQGTAR